MNMARIDTATTFDDFAVIAVDALNTWFDTDGFGPLAGKVDLDGILGYAAAHADDEPDGCPDCADDYDGLCGGCRAEGIALGAGGR